MTTGDLENDKPFDPVGDAALDWFVRRQAGRETALDGAFETWRQADPAHAAAYARLEALWSAPAFANAVARQAPRRRARAVPARVVGVAASAALVLVLGAGVLRLAGIPLRLPADYATPIGTEQAEQLEDGTQLVLDTASAVDVRYSGAQREVNLREGRVFFAIAADPRPFRVKAGDVLIRDIGTAFSVDRQGSQVRVVVRRGEVALAPAGVGVSELHLHAGEQGGYAGGHLTPATATDPDIAFAWLDHRLFFQQRPLGDVVDDLRRYHRGWIVIANPALETIKVSGGYDLNDPVAAIRDLARLSGASLIRVSDRLLILR